MGKTFINIWEGICGISVMSIMLFIQPLRSKYRTWGSTTEEVQRELPGDDLVKKINGWYNHAITINAKPADVWPWIVQLGQNKGGFYSYELLENIVGCKIHNADKIVPEFQDTVADDKVAMRPRGAPYIVSAINPDRAMILQLRVNLQTQETVDINEPLPDKYQDSSWLFFLEEDPQGNTRLISRSRNDWNQSKTNTIFYGIFGAITPVMDVKMLKGIRKRAESALTR